MSTSTTAHDAVISAVIAALLVAPALADGNVLEEAEWDVLPEGMARAIVVTLQSSTPSRGAIRGARVDWTTVVRLDCHARGDRQLAAGRASRALHAQAFARLLADPSLGGLVDDVQEPTLSGEAAFLGARLGSLAALYPIQHRTQARSLEVTTP